MIGAGNSVPSKDQVPELMNAVLPPADTDATADALSWHAGAITGVPLNALQTSLRSGPTTVPGAMIVASNRDARPISSTIFVAHVRVAACTNCVVVATVYSEQRRPVSQ